MQHLITRALVAIGLVSCLATPGFAQASFSDIVGRTLSNEQGSLVINADGTLQGQFGSSELTATWDVEGGLFCRQGAFGDRSLDRACQSIVLRGNDVDFVNQDGSVSSSYSLN